MFCMFLYTWQFLSLQPSTWAPKTPRHVTPKADTIHMYTTQRFWIHKTTTMAVNRHDAINKCNWTGHYQYVHRYYNRKMEVLVMVHICHMIQSTSMKGNSETWTNTVVSHWTKIYYVQQTSVIISVTEEKEFKAWHWSKSVSSRKQ